jgi:hypothetical protein
MGREVKFSTKCHLYCGKEPEKPLRSHPQLAVTGARNHCRRGQIRPLDRKAYGPAARMLDFHVLSRSSTKLAYDGKSRAAQRVDG